MKCKIVGNAVPAVFADVGFALRADEHQVLCVLSFGSIRSRQARPSTPQWFPGQSGISSLDTRLWTRDQIPNQPVLRFTALMGSLVANVSIAETAIDSQEDLWPSGIAGATSRRASKLLPLKHPQPSLARF